MSNMEICKHENAKMINSNELVDQDEAHVSERRCWIIWFCPACGETKKIDPWKVTK